MREHTIEVEELHDERRPAETIDTWTDHLGRTWRVPNVNGRLQMKIPSHAAIRDFVLFRDKVCQWCGAVDNLVDDHIISRRNGGSHLPSNMMALCQSCNSRKSCIFDKFGFEPQMQGC